MSDRLEEDPALHPRARGFLATATTRLVGVWGRSAGLSAANPGGSVSGLVFLSSRPWLVVGRMLHGGGPDAPIRAVSTADGFEAALYAPRT
ncbi:MAG TPA: hypothetical protein VMV18_10015, partial [bacterium]|nr:hypothetical protein [bacterium]